MHISLPRPQTTPARLQLRGVSTPPTYLICSFNGILMGACDCVVSRQFHLAESTLVCHCHRSFWQNVSYQLVGWGSSGVAQVGRSKKNPSRLSLTLTMRTNKGALLHYTEQSASNETSNVVVWCPRSACLSCLCYQRRHRGSL